MRILDHHEIAELASAIDSRYGPMVLLGAYGGLRFGEVAALKVSSVDFLRRTVEITATLNEVQGRMVMGPPKTQRSRRRVALPEFVCVALAAHITRSPGGQDGMLFTSPEGGPIRRHNWRRRAWKPAVVSSVGEPCNFHDLRHSSVALLIKAGQHATLIQQRLGHSSIKTTLDVYGHLFPGMDEAAAEALNDAACGVGVGLASLRVAT